MVSSNYRALVEYDGTNYGGFQIQAHKPTIQGELECALQRITQEFVRVHGAGRTDAGVHARGQVVSFRSGWRHDVAELQRALNAVLPQDIAVMRLDRADESFHARFSADTRVYVYSLYTSRLRAPLLGRYAQHVPEPVDVQAMAGAAALLQGERDYAAFGQPTWGECTVRRVLEAWLEPASLSERKDVALLRFWIEANGFLRGMVRRIVGTLLQVGTGRMSLEGFAEVLNSCDIARSAAPAPACGLCLWQVRYRGESEQDAYNAEVGRFGWQGYTANV